MAYSAANLHWATAYNAARLLFGTSQKSIKIFNDIQYQESTYIIFFNLAYCVPCVRNHRARHRSVASHRRSLCFPPSSQLHLPKSTISIPSSFTLCVPRPRSSSSSTTILKPPCNIRAGNSAKRVVDNVFHVSPVASKVSGESAMLYVSSIYGTL